MLFRSSVNYCIEFINTLTKIEIDNGIYNVGTGKPKTFLEFSNDIMEAAQICGSVEYIEMPIRGSPAATLQRRPQRTSRRRVSDGPERGEFLAAGGEARPQDRAREGAVARAIFGRRLERLLHGDLRVLHAVDAKRGPERRVQVLGKNIQKSLIGLADLEIGRASGRERV